MLVYTSTAPPFLTHLLNLCLCSSSGPEAPERWVTKRPVGAFVTAKARVYHHHGPPHQRTRRAAEGHLSGAGPMGHAAGGVAASAAVAQPVRVGTDAALVNQPNGARRCVAGLTPPPLSRLDVHKHTLVRTTRRRNGRRQSVQSLSFLLIK